MSVRCKMTCHTVKATGDGFEAEFQAVSDGSPENEEFFKYTPAASMKLAIVAKNHFEPGKTYYVDISPSEE